ncbi:MAG TPA: GAF and ANTAR domain-containing protein [Candidatus Nanopelagicales bacterium]|nr:GAF and ANTAR domain-containing protein [Candidatus Nanopelagicales bacterium]
MGDQEETTRRLSEVATGIDAASQALAEQPTTPGALDEIVVQALATVESADHAGITLVRGEGFVTPAASDAIPERVDRAQYELAEGPCVDASTRDSVFRGEDLTIDPRWPRFAPRALELGVCSMLAVPLFQHDQRRGALNLYASTPGAFDEQDEAVAVIFGAQASLALDRARQHESVQQLEEALDNSRLIGTAVGILMGSRGLTEQQAMQVLRTASQRRNRKVSELAQAITYTGELPP